MEDNFFSFKPENQKISQLIDYYYVSVIKTQQETHSIIYYPNYVAAINYYENADVSWNDEGRTIRQNTKGKSVCLLTRNIGRSRYVTTIGSVRKVGIIFKPLGINHFIDCDLKLIADQPINYFHYFGESFLSVLDQVLNNSAYRTSPDLLDNFFLSIYQDFRQDLLKEMVLKIFQSKGSISVKELSNLFGISRKTILRLFQNHLCTTPSDFITLVKFRNALYKYDTEKKLSHLAYECHFYDQADFIRKFKQLGGLTPKKLFRQIVERGNNGTLWSPR